jgi:hypothetical protein
MQDVLALLNIQDSYKERISQLENLMKQKNHKELNLTVISSTLKYEQNTYVITPSGLKNSKRNANDGIVLFGYEKKSVIKKQNENINTDNNIYSNESLRNNINTNNNDLDLTNVFTLNDFVFPVEEKEENVGLYEFPNFAIFYKIQNMEIIPFGTITYPESSIITCIQLKNWDKFLFICKDKYFIYEITKNNTIQLNFISNISLPKSKDDICFIKYKNMILYKKRKKIYLLI